QAEALLAVQRARAEAIRLINEANPSPGYLTLKSFDTAESMANGQATKIIVPSDIANLAGTFAALSETVKKNEDK
ncbi:MAG: peptidase, partial [Lachnospiraceae bacterium]|nr:peptidase [Lachnospiraceae bacterium]